MKRHFVWFFTYYKESLKYSAGFDIYSVHRIKVRRSSQWKRWNNCVYGCFIGFMCLQLLTIACLLAAVYLLLLMLVVWEEAKRKEENIFRIFLNWKKIFSIPWNMYWYMMSRFFIRYVVYGLVCHSALWAVVVLPVRRYARPKFEPLFEYSINLTYFTRLLRNLARKLEDNDGR